MADKRIRVLVAKPGLDGHEVDARNSSDGSAKVRQPERMSQKEPEAGDQEYVIGLSLIHI